MANRRLPSPDHYMNLFWNSEQLTDKQLERALQELPDEEIERVVNFFVSGNEFEETPEAMSRLRNLEWLWCGSSEQLVRLSPTLFKLTGLKRLSCCLAPSLCSVPSNCTALTNLETLQFSDTALPIHLAVDILNNNSAIRAHLRLLAIYRLKPARAVARTLLLIRRFRETKLNGLQLDCAKLICQMIVQDGDSVEWEPLLERK